MPERPKTLILTGDDFGRSATVNAAIEAAHEAGVLTQASLMVNEAGAADAVRIAQRHPQLCIGLHLTLCAGLASQISLLTNARGELPASPAEAGLRYFFQRQLEPAITAEIERQFHAFLALGFPPSYWDGHTHLHLHPTILRLTLPIASRLGFGFVRLVREPRPRSVLGQVFARLSAFAAPALQRRQIAFADQVLGLRETGRMRTGTLVQMIHNVPPGLTEIYWHPGAEPEPLDFAAVREALRVAAPRLGNARTLARVKPPQSAD